MGQLDALLAASWQGAALGLFVFAFCRLSPKIPARFQAWLWWAVCLKMVLLVLGEFTCSLPLRPASSSAEISVGENAPSAPFRLPLSHPSPAIPPTFDPSHLIPILWLLGVVLVATAFAIQALHLVALFRRSSPMPQGSVAEEARRLGAAMGLSRRPEVRLSADISGPMVVRPWGPTVLLPESFTAQASKEEVRLALAHELAHVRRGDLWPVIMPVLTQSLLWFHPIAWFAAREWATERESACDAEALTFTGGSPAEYGRLLVKIVAEDHRGGLAHALGATAAYHTLRRRLNLMKTYVPRTSRALRVSGGALAALTLIAALPWTVTAQTPASSGSEPVPKSLVTNPGFEDGLNGWKKDELRFNARPMEATATLDTTEHHSGKASLKFTKTEVSFNPVLLLDQELPTAAATKRLKVSMWVKATKARKATLAVMFPDHIEWGAYVGEAKDGDGPVNHDWKRYDAVLEVPPHPDSIILALEMYGPGTVWIDDVTADFVPDSTPIKKAIAES